MLSAFAYSRFVKANPFHVSRAGNKNKTSEQSTEIEPNTSGIKSNEAKGEAIRLQAECNRFLERNKATYNLYNSGVTLNTPQRTSFRITKVPRSTQR